MKRPKRRYWLSITVYSCTCPEDTGDGQWYVNRGEFTDWGSRNLVSPGDKVTCMYCEKDMVIPGLPGKDLC